MKGQCLLPLANVPLIEYTLEFLARAGVEDVYVFCSARADQIDKYIKYYDSQHACGNPDLSPDNLNGYHRMLGSENYV